MLHLRYQPAGWSLLCLLLVATVCVFALSGAIGEATAQNQAQNVAVARAAAANKAGTEDGPLFTEYKGVRIGMSATDARHKLGDPQDKGDEQDFFVFNDKESVQVFYDKAHLTYAISINYLGTGNSIPTPRAVLGTELEAKPDGSMYKMQRYPKAGYWVSYSRTAGNDPLTTITMQKIGQ